MPFRIAIGGSPNNGKSTLAASLYVQLAARGLSVGLHEVDVYSDTLPCILGHKPWEKRRKRSRAWSWPTVEGGIQRFVDDQHDVVLGDLPGRIEGVFISQMASPAHAAIVVAKNPDAFLLWEQFFTERHIPILFYVVSHLGQIPLPLPPYNRNNVLYVGGLKREVHNNGDVSCAAEFLIRWLVSKSFIKG
jgi:hypothetical protein